MPAPGSTRDAAVGPDGGRCVWCAGGEGDLKELRLRVPDQIALNRFWVRLPVHPRHERPVRRFAARFRRDGRRFVLAVVAAITVPVAYYALLHALELPGPVRERWTGGFAGPYLAGLGVLFVRCPFATPLTSFMVGLRHATWLVRIAGLAFLGVGVWRTAGLVG